MTIRPKRRTTRLVAMLASLAAATGVMLAVAPGTASAAEVPAAPTDFAITANVAQLTATITWAPPADNGGSSITGYLVARDAGTVPGQNPWSTVLAAGARSHTFKYLKLGSTYVLSVQAINAVGAGPAATGQVTISSTVPSAPTAFTITQDDAARTATIGWKPPASDGGSPVTGYLVARDAGTLPGQNPWSTVVAATARSHTFKLLVPGSTYTLSVQAITAAGVGPAASGQVTIGTAGGNLMTNPGFELDANADGRPDGWTSNARFTRSSAQVYTGSFAGRHRATDNSGYTVTQVVPSLGAGVDYKFSGRVSIPTTSDTFAFVIRIRWLNSSGSVLRTDVVRRYTDDTGGWTLAADTATSPAGTARAQVQMVLSSLNATVYVDAFGFAQS